MWHAVPRVAARAKQIDSMLRDETLGRGRAVRQLLRTGSCVGSHAVAVAALSRQSPRLERALWRPRAARESAELLRRLLDAGLSRFEPDPLGAIEEAEAKRRAAK